MMLLDRQVKCNLIVEWLFPPAIGEDDTRWGYVGLGGGGATSSGLASRNALNVGGRPCQMVNKTVGVILTMAMAAFCGISFC